MFNRLGTPSADKKSSNDVSRSVSALASKSSTSISRSSGMFSSLRRQRSTSAGSEASHNSSLASRLNSRNPSELRINTNLTGNFLTFTKGLVQTPSPISPQRLNTLQKAVYDKDIKKLKKALLEKKRDINKTDTYHGFTALHVAVQHGLFDICQLLLEYVDHEGKGSELKRVNPNIEDSEGRSALMLAVIGCNYQIVELLLKHHADINLIDAYGCSTLHYAMLNGDYAMFDFLCSHGASKEVVDKSGFTLLHHATRTGDLKFVQMAACDQLINIKNHIGETPLHLAAARGNLEIAKLLIAKGANPMLADVNDRKPIDCVPSDPEAEAQALKDLLLLKELATEAKKVIVKKSFLESSEIQQVVSEAAQKLEETETVPVEAMSGSSRQNKDAKRAGTVPYSKPKKAVSGHSATSSPKHPTDGLGQINYSESELSKSGLDGVQSSESLSDFSISISDSEGANQSNSALLEQLGLSKEEYSASKKSARGNADQSPTRITESEKDGGELPTPTKEPKAAGSKAAGYDTGSELSGEDDFDEGPSLVSLPPGGQPAPKKQPTLHSIPSIKIHDGERQIEPEESDILDVLGTSVISTSTDELLTRSGASGKGKSPSKSRSASVASSATSTTGAKAGKDSTQASSSIYELPPLPSKIAVTPLVPVLVPVLADDASKAQEQLRGKGSRPKSQDASEASQQSEPGPSSSKPRPTSEIATRKPSKNGVSNGKPSGRPVESVREATQEAHRSGQQTLSDNSSVSKEASSDGRKTSRSSRAQHDDESIQEITDLSEISQLSERVDLVTSAALPPRVAPGAPDMNPKYLYDLQATMEKKMKEFSFPIFSGPETEISDYALGAESGQSLMERWITRLLTGFQKIIQEKNDTIERTGAEARSKIDKARADGEAAVRSLQAELAAERESHLQAQDKISELSAALQARERDANDTRAQLSYLETKLDSTNSKLVTAEKQLGLITASHDALQAESSTQIASLTSQNDRLMHELTALKDEYAKASSRASEELSRIKVEHMEEKVQILSSFEKERQDAAAERRKLVDDAQAEREETAEQHQEEVEKLQAQVETIGHATRLAVVQYMLCKRERDLLTKRLGETATSDGAKSKTEEEILRAVPALDLKEMLGDAHLKLEAKVLELTARSKRERDAQTALEKTVAEYEFKNSELVEEIQELQAQIGAEKKITEQLNEAIGLLNSEAQKTTESQITSQKEISAIKTQLQHKNQEIQQQIYEKEQLQQQHNKLKLDYDLLKDELATEKTLVDSRSRQIDALRNQIKGIAFKGSSHDKSRPASAKSKEEAADIALYYEGEIKLLTEQFEEERSLRQAREAEYQQVIESLSVLEENLRDLRTLYDAEVANAKGYEETLSQLNEQIIQDTAQIEIYRADIKEYETSVRKMKKTIAEQEAALESLTERERVLSAENEVLEKEVKFSKQLERDLREQMGQIQKVHSSQEKSLVEMKSKVELLKHDNESKEQIYKETHASYLKNDLEQKALIGQLTQQIAELQSHVNRHEASQVELTLSTDERVAKLNLEIVRMKEDLQASNEACSQQQKHAADLNREIEKLRRCLEDERKKTEAVYAAVRQLKSKTVSYFDIKGIGAPSPKPLVEQLTVMDLSGPMPQMLGRISSFIQNEVSMPVSILNDLEEERRKDYVNAKQFLAEVQGDMGTEPSLRELVETLVSVHIDRIGKTRDIISYYKSEQSGLLDRVDKTLKNIYSRMEDVKEDTADETKRAIQAMKVQISELETQNEDLRNNIKKRDVRLNEIQEEKLQIYVKAQELEVEIKHLRAGIKASVSDEEQRERILGYERILQTKDKEMQKLIAELGELTTNRSALLGQIKSLEDDKREQDQKIAKLQKSLKEGEAHIIEQNVKLVQSEKDINSLKLELVKGRNEAEIAKRALVHETATREEQSAQSKRALDQSSERIAELNELIKRLRQQLSEGELKLSKLAAELESSNVTVWQLRQQSEAEKARTDDLLRQKQDHADHVYRDLQRLQNEHKEVDEEKKALAEASGRKDLLLKKANLRIESLEQAMIQLESKMQVGSESFGNLEKRAKESQLQIESLRIEKENLVGILEQKQANFNQAGRDIEAVTRQYKETLSKLEIVQRRSQEQQDYIKKLEEESKVPRRELELCLDSQRQLESQLYVEREAKRNNEIRFERAKKQLEDEIANMNSVRTKLEERIAFLENQRRLSDVKTQELLDTITSDRSLKQQLREAKDSLAEAEVDYRKLQSLHAQLRREFEDMDVAYKAAKKFIDRSNELEEKNGLLRAQIVRMETKIQNVEAHHKQSFDGKLRKIVARLEMQSSEREQVNKHKDQATLELQEVHQREIHTLQDEISSLKQMLAIEKRSVLMQSKRPRSAEVELRAELETIKLSNQLLQNKIATLESRQKHNAGGSATKAWADDRGRSPSPRRRASMGAQRSERERNEERRTSVSFQKQVETLLTEHNPRSRGASRTRVLSFQLEPTDYRLSRTTERP